MLATNFTSASHAADTAHMANSGDAGIDCNSIERRQLRRLNNPNPGKLMAEFINLRGVKGYGCSRGDEFPL